eukprot:FR744112.1.p1 GENE.FR744112.1~~FR744112.1.p1  ORF type:complete len:101 (+),score=3.70 FR744112.1:190-492(+)
MEAMLLQEMDRPYTDTEHVFSAGLVLERNNGGPVLQAWKRLNSFLDIKPNEWTAHQERMAALLHRQDQENGGRYWQGGFRDRAPIHSGTLAMYHPLMASL